MIISPSSALRAATDAFVEYVQAKSLEALLDCACLADYVDNWLVYGGGFKECGNNFPQFLAVFALICHRWHQSPNILDFRGSGHEPLVKRRVSAIFSDDGMASYDILDPFRFEFMMPT